MASSNNLAAEEIGLLVREDEEISIEAYRRRQELPSDIPRAKDYFPARAFLARGLILIAALSLLIVVTSQHSSLRSSFTKFEESNNMVMSPVATTGDEDPIIAGGSETDDPNWEPPSFQPPETPDSEPVKPPDNENGVPVVNDPDDIKDDDDDETQEDRPNDQHNQDSLLEIEYSYSYTTYSPTYSPTYTSSYSYSLDMYSTTYFPTYSPTYTPTIEISQRTHPQVGDPIKK